MRFLSFLALLVILSISVQGKVTPYPKFNISSLIGQWWVTGSINVSAPFHDMKLITTMVCPMAYIHQGGIIEHVTFTLNYTDATTAQHVQTSYNLKPQKDNQAILHSSDFDLIVTYFDNASQVIILVESNQKFLLTLSKVPEYNTYTAAMTTWLNTMETPPIDSSKILRINNSACCSSNPIIRTLKATDIAGGWYLNIHYTPENDTTPCQTVSFSMSPKYAGFYNVQFYASNHLVTSDLFLPLGNEQSYWVPANILPGLVFSYKFSSQDIYFLLFNDGSEGYVFSKKPTLEQKDLATVLGWFAEHLYNIRNLNIINNNNCTYSLEI